MLELQEKPKEVYWYTLPLQAESLRVAQIEGSHYYNALKKDVTGLFSQEIKLRASMRQHIILSSFGSTGCLSLEEGIGFATPSGVKFPKDFKDNDIFYVNSFNFLKKRVETDLAKIFHTGKKRLFRITLESGKTLDASIDHKFFVWEKCGIKTKAVKDLKPNMHIIKCR